MNKLLAQYRANPTLANAVKLRSYDRTHPFAACLLSRADADTLADALDHVDLGNIVPVGQF